jgi:S1-C subfamily serine protease
VGRSVAGQADAIAQAVDPGIVDVNTTLRYGGGAGAGTGMILTTSGAVLTNNHVIDGATSMTVTLVDTGRTYPATVVGTDATHDIAVIQIHGASGLKIDSAQASAVPGAAVAGVVAGTPAAAAGLGAGDIITSVNGQPITSPQALSALTGSHHPGEKVTVAWTDPSSAQHHATIVLASGPAD